MHAGGARPVPEDAGRPRQEDLNTVVLPTTLVLVVAVVVAFQAAGDVASWEVALAAVLMLAAIAVVVRLGGRAHAGPRPPREPAAARCGAWREASAP